ncbi:MAG: sigma-70 family RNA polymerase sigma factor [Balneolaceae bacterium]|nr:sigma-70 family RNA polymerase sigma factor [Balneolaceae bacterium]
MAEASDEELVEKCLLGENSAFDTLVKKYELSMYRTALGIVNDSDLARDVTQAAFLKSWEKLSTFNSEYKFYSWLYRIVIHEALNTNRDSKKTAPLRLYNAESESPYEKLLRKEEYKGLMKAVETLSDDYKVVIQLRHFEELSYQEISDILKIEVKTVKSRLYTARLQLRKKLYNR